MKNPLSDMKRPNAKGIKAWALANKKVSALVAVALLSAAYGTLHAGKASASTSYVLGTVSTGTVVTSVSGTGTVSASRQLDVKPKASGDVIAVDVKAGDAVTAGQTLVSLDATDALNALKSEQISYQKLTEPEDQSTLISAEQSVTDAQSAQSDAYDSAWSDVASTYSDLGTIIDSENDLFYDPSGFLNDQPISALGSTVESYRTKAGMEFDSAKASYLALGDEYKGLSRQSPASDLDTLLSNSTSVTQALLESLKDAQATINYVKTITENSQSAKTSASAADTAGADVSAWTSEVNGHLTSLTSDASSIASAPQSLAAKQASLAKLQEGADPLDIQSAELNLSELEQNYADTFVKAPFSGIVGKVDVSVGDSASAGTAVATLISSDSVADVSLNEVDAAKVKTGDKATLTFDAIPGLSVSGTVSELDLIGTVTQGVVNYAAQITLDSEDARVLPGMSVSAEIITSSAENVLVVPSSAVKTSGGTSYVQVFDPALPSAGGTSGVASKVPPTNVPVEIGLEGDTTIEITSGLTEGEQIVTRTTTGAAATTAAAAPSLFGGAAGGAARGGGGAAAATGGGATRALGR